MAELGEVEAGRFDWLIPLRLKRQRQEREVKR